MKTVEKWVAGFFEGELIVVEAKFYETADNFGLVVGGLLTKYWRQKHSMV